MGVLLRFGMLVIAAFACQARPDGRADVPELTDSQYGSLWPLPQEVKISPVTFSLSSSTFQIVHSAKSSAGPGCFLLQNAFRRLVQHCCVSVTVMFNAVADFINESIISQIM